MNRVGVLMPVLNGEKTVERAIRSVMAQTYTWWSMTVVDNGSTDDTVNIVNRLAAEDKRIFLMTCEAPGIVPALNTGLYFIMTTSANHIARIDADDAWEPTKLDQQIDVLNKHPDVSIVGTQILRVEGPDFRPCATQQRYPTEDIKIKEMLFTGNNAIAHPSVIFRREVALRTGGYDNTYPIAEDYHLWLKAAVWFNFANLDETLVHYTVTHNPKYDPRCPQLCCISMKTAVQQLHQSKRWRQNPQNS